MRSFMVIAILLLSLCMTGCPKSTLQSAAKADYQLSTITLTAVRETRTACEQGVFPRSTCLKISSAFAKVIDGGKAFSAELKTVDQSQPVTQTELQKLNLIFSTEVVSPFLDILGELKALTPAQAQTLMASINAVRLAILTIAGAFTTAGIQTPGMGVFNEYA